MTTNTDIMKSRGRAYQCLRCDWTGERSWATEHFVKKHSLLEEAPFACRVCRFKATKEREIEKHFSKEQHKKLAKNNSCILKSKNEVHLELHFNKLSFEESASVWRSKRKTKEGGEEDRESETEKEDEDEDRIGIEGEVRKEGNEGTSKTAEGEVGKRVNEEVEEKGKKEIRLTVKSKVVKTAEKEFGGEVGREVVKRGEKEVNVKDEQKDRKKGEKEVSKRGEKKVQREDEKKGRKEEKEGARKKDEEKADKEEGRKEKEVCKKDGKEFSKKGEKEVGKKSEKEVSQEGEKEVQKGVEKKVGEERNKKKEEPETRSKEEVNRMEEHDLRVDLTGPGGNGPVPDNEKAREDQERKRTWQNSKGQLKLSESSEGEITELILDSESDTGGQTRQSRPREKMQRKRRRIASSSSHKSLISLIRNSSNNVSPAREFEKMDEQTTMVDIKALESQSCSSTTERPSIISTAVMGVTNQLITNNSLLNQVCRKLDSFVETSAKRFTQDTRPDNSARHIMGDVKAEMRTLNQLLSQQGRGIINLDKSVIELSNNIKSNQAQMNSIMNGVMASLNTFAAVVSNRVGDQETADLTNHSNIIDPTTPTTSTINMPRPTQEFERDWQHSANRRDSQNHHRGQPTSRRGYRYHNSYKNDSRRVERKREVIG